VIVENLEIVAKEFMAEPKQPCGYGAGFLLKPDLFIRKTRTKLDVQESLRVIPDIATDARADRNSMIEFSDRVSLCLRVGGKKPL
jgi:hypothetical protein